MCNVKVLKLSMFCDARVHVNKFRASQWMCEIYSQVDVPLGLAARQRMIDHCRGVCRGSASVTFTTRWAMQTLWQSGLHTEYVIIALSTAINTSFCVCVEHQSETWIMSKFENYGKCWKCVLAVSLAGVWSVVFVERKENAKRKWEISEIPRCLFFSIGKIFGLLVTELENFLGSLNFQLLSGWLI